MPERHPGKIEPAAALGERLTHGVGGQPGGSCSLFHSPAPNKLGRGECGPSLAHSASWWDCSGTGPLAGQAGKGAAGPGEAAPSWSIPLPEPTVTSIRAPRFLAFPCGQGGTILSPEAESRPLPFLSPPSCLHLNLDLSLRDGAVCSDPPSVQG